MEVDEAKNQKYALEIPAQHYIRSPVDKIVKILVNDLDTERDKMRFIDFVTKITELYTNRLQRHCQIMRTGFDVFCPDTPGDGTPMEVNDDNDDGEDTAIVDLERREDAFIESLHQSFKMGNYNLLSEEYYQTAASTDFEVGIEMKMDTSKLQSDFIRRLHAKHAEDDDFKDAAEITKDVLIYHRGIGQATHKGLSVHRFSSMSAHR
eukprot:m.1300401 g.1300401  ORF g.1300401 m.1300401 type:complete len:207 (-) comp24803_c0_seq2:4408-5028(-)